MYSPLKIILKIDNAFQFPTATKKNTKNSNNMESLTLQVDGPITGRAYVLVGVGAVTGIFHFSLKVDGPITISVLKVERLIGARWGWGGG